MVIVWATVLTVGISMGNAALPMIIADNVDRRETSAANGVNTLLRSIGMSVGSSFVAAVGVMFATQAAGQSVPVPSWTANVAVFIAGAVAALLAFVAAWFTGTSKHRRG